MTTLAELLTRTGEAVLDLAGALPADLDLLEIGATGYDFGHRFDVRFQVRGLAEGLRAVQALGGAWKHGMLAHEPGAPRVHHRWTGVFQGSTVEIAAIWNAEELPADIVPMVEQLPPVTHHWEYPDDAAWKARELAEHPEVADQVDAAIDAVHRLALAGAL